MILTSQYIDSPIIEQGFSRYVEMAKNVHKLDDFMWNPDKKFDVNSYDKVIFSYHGVPNSHVDKVYDDGLCSDNNCELGITEKNKFCYKATVYETTKLIANKLNLDTSKYEVTFQSRLTNKWLDPFSDKVLELLPSMNQKKVLVFSPAFTADCLETIFEIGDEYKELQIEL